jgi:hypothetical protein
MPQETVDGASVYITTKKATINGLEMTGFCFDLDHDSVWLEGTGEMAVAYRTAGKDYTADFYIGQMEKVITPSPKNSGLAGLPYATNPGTHYGEGKLWAGVDTNLSLASSAWYLLGKMRYDPMQAGRKKSIPKKEMFWADDK